jgi:membrane protein
VAATIALGRRIAERFFALEPLERALALSSKLFIALIPTTILTSRVLGPDTSLGDSLVERFGLDGVGASAVRQLFASPDEVRSGISVLGVMILAYAVLSMAQALQRIYEDAWGLPRIRARGAFRALIWMVTFVLYVILLSPIRNELAQADSRLLRIYLPLILGSLVWAITPHILLSRRVPTLQLLPSAILTAIVLTVFSVVSRIYLPTVMSTDAERYGLIGAAFGIVSWLFAAAVVLIACATTGAVLAGADLDETRPDENDAGPALT